MFDPYHKWLGIRKDQRPPTCYQLLGVSPDEQDTEVIEEAAIRQTTHVRSYQRGEHAAECTQLLKEISTARLTLLNPAKRKHYDEQLAQAGMNPPAAGVAPVTADADAAGITASAPAPASVRPGVMPVGPHAEALDFGELTAEPVRPTYREKGKPSAVPIGLLIGAGAAVAVLLVLVIGIGGAFFFFSRGEPQPKKDGMAIVQNKGKDGNKPIRDGAEKDKENPRKIDDLPKKDDAKKDDVKINPPAPDPVGFVVTPKGKVPPEPIVELPGGIHGHCLMADGLRMVYSIIDGGHVCYRDAPRFDVERRIDRARLGAWPFLIPHASAPDASKMAIVAGSGDGWSLIVWNWNTQRVEDSWPTVDRSYEVAFAPDMKHVAAYAVHNAPGKPQEHWVHLFKLGAGPNDGKRWQLNGPLSCLGFTPDSSKFFFADALGQSARAYSFKTGTLSDMAFAQPRLHHTFSPDFSHFAVKQNTVELRAQSIDTQLPPRTIRGPVNHLIDGAAFSADNRFLLIGTHTGDHKNAQGQMVLLDWKAGTVVAATEPSRGVPHVIQLGRNGVALVASHGAFARLIRFPTGPGDALVKTDPPIIPVVDEKDFVHTKIVNRNSGKVIGVWAKRKQDGTHLVQWEFMKNEPNQLWALVPTDNGWFHIVNVNSGTCLSVNNDSTEEGAALVIWQKKDKAAAQQWKPVPFNKTDATWVRIINRASGRAISVKGGIKEDGATLYLQQEPGANGLWKLDIADAVAKTSP